MATIPINKTGNLEIDRNTAKFRTPLTEFKIHDVNIIEKGVKRQIQSTDDKEYYLEPFEIQIINSSVVFYYDLQHYKSFNYIRALSFQEKIKYFTSLVEIAKNNDQLKVIWNPINFVVDAHEERFKVMIYETEDLSVYEEAESFNAVREFIIMTLTTLNRVTGKPKRTDFLDQDSNIIEFVETLLKIDNLDDMDHYINTKYIEYVHGNVEEEIAVTDSEPKQPVMNRFFNFKEKSKEEGTTFKGNVKKKPASNKKLFIISCVAIGAALMINAVLGSLNNSNTDTKDKVIESSYTETDTKPSTLATVNKKAPNKTADKFNNELLSAYRLSLMDKPKEAVFILEGIGYDKLSNEDRTILMNLYKKSKQYYKIIDLKPNQAEEVINELIANNREQDMINIKEHMKTSNVYVDFEVAYLEKNYQKVIELKDQVNLNGRKEQQIVESYIALNKLNDAKQFAQEVGNPVLLEDVKALSY